jgi:hypothetical protein
MLAKVIGAFLLVIGLVLGLKLLGAALAFIFKLIFMVLAVAVVGGLIYFGWRLINKAD